VNPNGNSNTKLPMENNVQFAEEKKKAREGILLLRNHFARCISILIILEEYSKMFNRGVNDNNPHENNNNTKRNRQRNESYPSKLIFKSY
jgi:hypothetical protein